MLGLTDEEQANVRKAIAAGKTREQAMDYLRENAALSEHEGTSPLEGTLRAKDFSASSLSPLLGGILTRITGDMDAGGDDVALGVGAEHLLVVGQPVLDLNTDEINNYELLVRLPAAKSFGSR